MLKILMVFLVGFIEQLLYTAYILSVTKKKVITSSILMFTYMSIYLFLIAYALKDAETVPILISYALSCGAGNYVIMLWEENKAKKKYIKKLWVKFLRYINEEIY